MNEYGVVTEAGTFRLERVLPGPIERVWANLTESDKRGEWLASGEMELRPGGRMELVFRHSDLTPHEETPPEKYKRHEHGTTMHGRITKCDPPRLLACTWGEGAGGEGADASEVTFELTPQGQDVLLVVTHVRLRERAEMISVSGGWHVHLDILIDKLNGREPKPFWSTHAALEAEYARLLAAGK